MNERKKRVTTTVLALGLAMIALVLFVVALFQMDRARTEDVLEIEYVLGSEDNLSPFFSSQVMVRESMVDGLRTNDIDAFCDAYLEFMRISREEPIIPLMPEGAELILGEKDGWVIRLLMIDWYLIPDLARLSGFCDLAPLYQGTTG